MNIDRLQPYQANPEYRPHAHGRVARQRLQVPLPDQGAQTARGAKHGPLHDRLAARGAYFRDVSGWEGADWYAPAGTTPDAGAADLGTPDVVRALGRRAPGRPRGRDRHGHVVHEQVPRAGPRRRPRSSTGCRRTTSTVTPGVITYTQWLNEGGTLEADLTVTKLDDDSFWVVASDTAHRHALTWMRRHLAEDRRTPSSPTSRRATRRSTCRARVRASCCSRSRRATCPTTRSRSAPPARSTSATRGCCACGSPTSASSATSCTSRREQATHVYDRAGRGRRGVRPAPRRAEGAGHPADGEGVPRLRPRHRQHRLGARGRARVRRRAGQAGRVHRPRRGAGQEGRGSAHAQAGPGAGARPGADAVPRRAGAARRAARRLRARRLVRPHPRRSRRPGDGRGRQAAGHRTTSTAASGRSRSPGPATPPSPRCGRSTTPAMARIRA